MKLTLPQYRLLVKLSSTPVYCVPTYSPANKLIEMGLAVRDKRTNKLHITNAGRDRI